MTPLESIELRIAELDKEIAPLHEKMKPLLNERFKLVNARHVLNKDHTVCSMNKNIMRQKWSPAVYESIEERIASGESYDSIAADQGMKRQTLYAAMSYYRKAQKVTA